MSLVLRLWQAGGPERLLQVKPILLDVGSDVFEGALSDEFGKALRSIELEDVGRITRANLGGQVVVVVALVPDGRHVDAGTGGLDLLDHGRLLVVLALVSPEHERDIAFG